MASFPSFYEDPLFRPGQELASKTGQELLRGEPGEYFSGIGQVGGQQLEDLIRMSTSDVTRNIEEITAGRHQRGGVVPSLVGKAVGDVSTKLRFQDFLRAMRGRQSLLNTGAGLVSDVGGKALNLGQQQNQFNVQKYQAESAEDAAKSGRWGKILGSVANIGSAAFGMSQLGKIGSTDPNLNPETNKTNTDQMQMLKMLGGI